MKKKKLGRFDGKTIEIVGLKYKIRYLPKIKSKATSEPKVYYKGFLNTQKRIIKLRAGLPKDEEVQTLIHEIFHGIFDALIPADYITKISEYEDFIVEPLSRLLVSSLRSVGLLRI